MRSDNLTSAGEGLPEWAWRQEPPPFRDGPRCDHGVPMRVACPECPDPLRASGPDDAAPGPDAQSVARLVSLLLPLAIALAVLAGVAIGRASR